MNRIEFEQKVLNLCDVNEKNKVSAKEAQCKHCTNEKGGTVWWKLTISNKGKWRGRCTKCSKIFWPFGKPPHSG